MTNISVKNNKGTEYLYLEKPIRIGKKVRNITKYLGPKKKISHNYLKKATEEFESHILEREIEIRTEHYRNTTPEYPLTLEEIKKIEKMNLQYKNNEEIKRKR